MAGRKIRKVAATCKAKTTHGGKMPDTKKVIGGPLVIGGQTLSLSRAIRAGDTVYLTGQIPMQDGAPMTTGSIEAQTRAVLDEITATLALAGCTRDQVVKAMVWLRNRADFPGFNAVYAEYFPIDPPARSAVVSDLLVDVRVEVEVVAWAPQL
jgi:2-iminobutanoate/2-iminopropanoate deaminase